MPDHMPDAERRTCEELISNEGTEHRVNRVERECGLDADGYCADDAMYLCSIHREANHSLHKVARR